MRGRRLASPRQRLLEQLAVRFCLDATGDFILQTAVVFRHDIVLSRSADHVLLTKPFRISSTVFPAVTLAAVACGATPKIPRHVPGGIFSGCPGRAADVYCLHSRVGVGPAVSIVTRMGAAVSLLLTVMFVI
jgi:hypothetical protein